MLVHGNRGQLGCVLWKKRWRKGDDGRTWKVNGHVFLMCLTHIQTCFSLFKLKPCLSSSWYRVLERKRREEKKKYPFCWHKIQKKKKNRQTNKQTNKKQPLLSLYQALKWGKWWENSLKLLPILVFLYAFIGVDLIHLLHSFLSKTLFSFLHFILLSLCQVFNLKSILNLKLKKKNKDELLGFSSTSGILVLFWYSFFLEYFIREPICEIIWTWPIICNIKIEVELHIAGSRGNGQITLVLYRWRFPRLWDIESFLSSKTRLKTRYQGQNPEAGMELSQMTLLFSLNLHSIPFLLLLVLFLLWQCSWISVLLHHSPHPQPNWDGTLFKDRGLNTQICYPQCI